ncbi:hypothetical protein SUZIE_145850 [Sciurus carolinensis]|uniref:Uncharacterized protein n=1 Tax=Sciurus carolinensis TaxID=30640 RepID=A0AA41MTS0_SCICA|nr:hypothetical protein [Sciurus carolinensis]
METLCSPPRLAVPASPRGSPCSPTPRKPRRGTQVPCLLRPCQTPGVLSEPGAWGAGVTGPDAAGPSILRGHRWLGPDGLIPRGTGRAVRRSEIPSGRGCRCRGVPGRLRGGRGRWQLSAFRRSLLRTSAPLPRARRPREPPTCSASVPPGPNPGLESQPDPAAYQSQDPGSRPPPPPVGLSTEPALSRASSEPSLQGQEAAVDGNPLLAAPEASVITSSRVRAAGTAPSDLCQEHFDPLIRGWKLWCYAKGFEFALGS